MDKNQTNQTGGSIFDVARPGAVPASPFGKPVIAGNQNQVTDPMMSSSQSTPAAKPIEISDLDSVPIPENNEAELAEKTPEVTGEPEPSAPAEETATAPDLTPEQYADATAETPETPVVPAEPAAPIAPSVATTPQPTTSLLPNTPSHEPSHQLTHQQAFYGQLKSPKKKSKKILIILLLLILLGVAGYAGYYFYSQNKETPEPTTPVVTTPVTEKKKETPTKAFTSENGGFSLTNLYGWDVTDKDTAKDYPTMEGTYATVTFKINDKQNLVFNTNPGGRGGDCAPATKDVAFTKGNTCSSYKIVSAEALPEANLPLSKLFTDSAAAYLTTYQYMEGGADGDGVTYTLKGIEVTKLTNGKEVKLETGTSMMGAYSPMTIIPLKDVKYIDVKIVDADGKPTQLSEADLVKVENVLKTFKLN